jgi:ribosomal protein S18 acetylase RimI-like enzyme
LTRASLQASPGPSSGSGVTAAGRQAPDGVGLPADRTVALGDGRRVELAAARPDDLSAILELQRLAFETEAQLLGRWDIQPLRQTLAEIEAEFRRGTFLKAVAPDGRLVGSIRGFQEPDGVEVAKLMVRPDWRRLGLARRLALELEALFGPGRFRLFTASLSLGNLRLYEGLGYRAVREAPAEGAGVAFVFFEKIVATPGEAAEASGGGGGAAAARAGQDPNAAPGSGSAAR